MSTEFVLSFWCGPPKAEASIATYQQIKDAGFNLVFASCNEHYSPSEVQVHLSVAEAVGLKAIVTDNRIVGSHPCGESQQSTQPDWEHIEELATEVANDWKDQPANFGYFLGDEPNHNIEYFKQLGRLIGKLKELDPDRKAFVNLYPFAQYNPLPLGQDEAQYRQYINDFVEIAKPNVIAFDNYSEDTEGGRYYFSKNCRIFSEIAAANSLPFWVIINSLLPDAVVWSPTTEECMRWQAVEAIRHGTAGLWYFLYWMPPCKNQFGVPFGKHAGLIDAVSKQPTDRYKEVTRLNSDIRSLVSRNGEILFGRVRSNAGDLWLINSSDPAVGQGQTTARRLCHAAWPSAEYSLPGYEFVNEWKQLNGFWLFARGDLAHKTFYVLDVVDNGGLLYEVTKGTVKQLEGYRSWEDSLVQNHVGTFMDVNGFRVAIAKEFN